MNSPVKIGDAYVVVEDNTERPESELSSPEPNGTILPISSVEVYEGDTADRVIKRALDNESISSTGLDDSPAYVSEINGLSAFDGGEESGWMYMVNGYPPQLSDGVGAGMSDYEVEDHDFIQVEYTCQGYGSDLGMGWGISDENLISNVIANVNGKDYSLDKDFSNDVKEYNLFVKSGVSSVKILLEQNIEKEAGITTIKVGEEEYKFWQDIPVSDGTQIVLSDSANSYNINVVYDSEKPTYEISGVTKDMTSEKQNLTFTITPSDNASSAENMTVVVTFTNNGGTNWSTIEPVDGEYTVVLKDKNILRVKATDECNNFLYNSYNINYDYYKGLNPYPTKILEYMPAPGQYRYESSYDNPEKIFDESGMVSLGAFGGYVVAGFDYSIQNQNGEDFIINGNAFSGNEEPGSVMVMVDKNRNGKADDTWYEIAGESYNAKGTIHNYSVTYKNPGEYDSSTPANNNVTWEDSLGNTGYVVYNSWHRHSWYPTSNKWSEIGEDEYTLTGTKLSTRTPGNGYVDVSKDESFDISDAVDSDGNSVTLEKIDFVKIYTSTQINTAFGPTSCEVSYIKAMPQDLDNLDNGDETFEIITDLENDSNVNKSQFEFTASAINKLDGYDDVALNLEYVKLNDVEVTGEDGLYTVTLAEGENTIVIAVNDGKNEITKKYTISYI